jgi:outer membrane lipoprotein-sorting protein
VESPAAVSAADAALNEVLSAMQKAADGVKDLTADFTYIRILAEFEDESQKSGRLSFKKPEYVRIDFAKPYEEQRFVTPDRFVLYRPDVDVATVIRRDRTKQQEGSETLAIAMGTAPNKLRERFTLALVVDPDLKPEERQALRVVELLPKKGELPEEIVKVWLWVDAHDWLPQRVKSFARNGDTETFLFTNVKTNQKLTDSLFKFTPGPKTVTDDMTANPPPGL